MSECHTCNGTGIDNAHWTGRCFACEGSGWVPDDDREPDEDDGAEL